MSFTSAQVNAIPDIIFRLQASGLGLSNNTVITGWNNLANTGYFATAVGKPTFKTNVIGGKPAIRMATASGDYFNLSNGGFNLSSFTLFIVHQSSGDCIFLGDTVSNYQVRIGQGAVNQLSAYDGGNGAWNPFSTTLSASRTGWNVVEFKRDTELISFHEKGTARGYGRWGTSDNVWNQVGGLFNTPFVNGYIAEIILVSRKCTVEEEASIYDYINTEYGLTPSIVPTTYTYPIRPIPKLVSFFHYQNASGVDFGVFPIERGYNFTNPEINPDLLTFQTAVAGKIPNTGSVGYASLDLEVTSPGIIPNAATGYSIAPWRTNDRNYVISLISWFTSTYPNMKVNPYQQPYFTTDNLIRGSPGAGAWERLSTNKDLLDAWTIGSIASQNYSTPANLAGVLWYGKTIQPEIYPFDQTETQTESNYVASINVQLARDVSNYWIQPSGQQEICAFIWPQVVPGSIGATGPVGTFLSLPELTQRLLAIRLAGADTLFIGGDAAPIAFGGLYTPAQWQIWIDTVLGPALDLAGYLSSDTALTSSTFIMWPTNMWPEVFVNWPDTMWPYYSVRLSFTSQSVIFSNIDFKSAAIYGIDLPQINYYNLDFEQNTNFALDIPIIRYNLDLENNMIFNLDDTNNNYSIIDFIGSFNDSLRSFQNIDQNALLMGSYSLNVDYPDIFQDTNNQGVYNVVGVF